MAGELGKASLDLSAELGEFERNMATGRKSAEGMEHVLEAVAAAGDVAERALNEVKMGAGQAAESRASAESILSGVHGISDEAREAARELDHVKLTEAQAAETEAAGGVIRHVLNAISRDADRTKRKLVEAKLAGGRTGVGVGPFGSGFGRVGVLGAAVGVGALTAPAVAPAAVGLLAAIPALATAGAGALGTLALAFDGVGKAIGGDKKAFDELGPSAQKFVLTIRSLSEWFDKLKETAGASLFPGLTKGLKAALSPGTVAAITQAVTEFGHAIGAAGAQWGKYFGSAEFQAIFGPLMKSGARNLGVLADAFLHIFDALGVFMRAAIPFTNWLTDAIDKGAKFVDTWTHAKDASGALGRGLDEARTSLTLIVKLAGALLNVVGALGKALYPVAKVAVKALTDGLNALSGIIERNQGVIRTLVGGALDALIGAVKVAAAGIGLFVRALRAIGGQKAVVIAAITAIGAVIALTLGPQAAVIIGAIAAVGLIRNHWKTIKTFFVNLGHEIVNAFKYVWYRLQQGALKAALAVVEPFSHLPGFLGGWARKAKDRMQAQLNKLHAPNMNWGGYAEKAGAYTGGRWRKGFAAGIAGLATDVFNAVGAAVHAYAQHRRHHHAPPSRESPFGTPPPFDKNTGSSGSRSMIPQRVSYLDALAARQDQEAAALNYKGKAARRHLEKEIADYQKADRILEEKLKHAHGARRTALYNALTRNQKKIAEARKRATAAITSGRQAALDYALDQSKLAVEKAKEGSKAWDRAIAAEEKALKAEIRYWDKRAHNAKLSRDARDQALRKELSYERQLHRLENQHAKAAAANEAQFLQSFIDIQNTFASNAMPSQQPAPGSGKTNTHLYDIKNEARQTNQHLAAMRRRDRFPGSDAGYEAAMAVT